MRWVKAAPSEVRRGRGELAKSGAVSMNGFSDQCTSRTLEVHDLA